MTAEVNWRERWRVAEAEDYLDRKPLRQMGILNYLLMVHRLDKGRVRRVPSGAVTEEGTDEQGQFAFVSCPCGAQPVVRRSLEKCSDCDRNYVLADVGSIYVAYGGETPPLLPGAHENRGT